MGLIDLGSLPEGRQKYRTFLDDLCETLGFRYSAYASNNPVTGEVHGFTNYPEAWQEFYAKNHYHQSDPTLVKSARSISPVNWNRLDRDRHFNAVFNAAHDFGIPSRGMTVPVRGPFGEVGLLSVVSDLSSAKWDKAISHSLTTLQGAAVHLHDMVMSSDATSRALRHPVLSTREIEVLQWVAAGKSQQDIGDILSISHRTVEVHLRSARTKLAALTTPQAIARAIGLGLIYPY